MNVDLVKRKDYLKEDFYKDRKIVYGGFKGQMNWSYYLTGFDKSLIERLESIKEFVKVFWDEIEDDFKSIRFCETYFFLFEDNFAISFTVRSWGDFMAAVENKNRTYKEFYEIDNI
jgi:hypothetical protein